MVQTVKSRVLSPGQQMMFIEKPHVLSRIFIKISALLSQTVGYKSWISFDDPKCVNYLTLNTLKREYEFECNDIPQGIVFIQKQSDAIGSISAIEILK